MKEIKLWEIGQKDGDKSVVLPLKNVDQTKTENQLEEILVKYPDLLGDGLKLVGRQTNTAGGPLDLLGVEDDG
jgi:RecB family endonuclease NucS